MTEIVLLNSAERDLQLAFEFYEETQDARGEEFIHRVDVALAILVSHPLAGPSYYKFFRRFLVQRFPFGIFYV